MLTAQERLKMAGQAHYIYLLREKHTGRILYVGCTRYIERRIREHRRALNNPKCYTAIYMYMRENNLQFFKDVEIVLAEHIIGTEEAHISESKYIEKYKDSVLNLLKYDVRKFNTDPRLRKVINKTTGQQYWSVKAAFEDIGVSRYILDKAIIKQTPIDGCYYEYI